MNPIPGADTSRHCTDGKQLSSVQLSVSIKKMGLKQIEDINKNYFKNRYDFVSSHSVEVMERERQRDSSCNMQMT